MNTMNEEAVSKLNTILTKSPQELNKDEIAFLKARVSYLKDSQVEEYKSVLTPNPAKDGKAKDGKK